MMCKQNQRTDAQNKADEHDHLKEATTYSHFRCRIQGCRKQLDFGQAY